MKKEGKVHQEEAVQKRSEDRRTKEKKSVA